MGDSRADYGVGEMLDWTVLKSIQEANAASTSAMEEYLLLTVGPEALGDAEQTRQYLKRSIEHHERVIDHLQLAAERLDQPAAAD